DLSSFKCGHDAPTYGIIDKIISTSGTPYSALHDIDANKPGGSIKIRVKTYAHSLSLHEEVLDDRKRKTDELKQRIEAKRAELMMQLEGLPEDSATEDLSLPPGAIPLPSYKPQGLPSPPPSAQPMEPP